ncbi:MAG: ribonuclease Y [Chloroflexi bacterium]|nr:ribonuclease Y [Chloroflexota bacterium]
MWFIWPVLLVIGTVAGFAVGYYLKNRTIGGNILQLQEETRTALAEARTEAMAIQIEARDKAQAILHEAENESARRIKEVARQETRLQERRDNLDRRVDNLEVRDTRLKEREQRLDARQVELDQAWQQHIAEMERISGLTQEQAKDLLLKEVEEEARIDAARIIREVEAQAHEEAEERAREIVTIAIQRVATDQVAETTVSAVELPNDEMKGRIIGRGGRNIRALEGITGVDLVIDDTPDTVILSSFDPVRREVARMALERLILDGRIHPGRIEKMVEKAQEEIDQTIREKGEEAALDLGIHGLPPEIIRLLGRLHYRTSYGQNVLKHSTETAMVAALIAAELGADVQQAKLAGLLHDLGKAVDHEVDGPHALIGAEIARRYGMPEPIVNAIGAHHSDIEQCSIEAMLIQVADAISAGRPGARRESLENYIKRIRALEQVANSFEGVESSYAIQAGREIRIMVKPEQVDDLAALRLSKDIARKVEESLQYPGRIKVTVIRELRATEYAQ